MRSLERSYSMEYLYRTIGKSRQHYMQNHEREVKTNQLEFRVIQAVINLRKDHPRMGSRAMFYSLKATGEDIGIGVTKFEQLLSERGFTVGKIRRSGPYTSDGKGKESYDNLTNGLRLNDTNQLVVADITYYWLEANWRYIFTLKDVYSQKILYLQPSRDMMMENGLKCIEEMVKMRGKASLSGCIHHSDNGTQYNAKKYKKALFNLQMKISRSCGCKENGSAEQLNHIVKNMYLNGWPIKTFRELQLACQEIMYLNNEKRAIAQLGYLSPNAYESKLKNIPLENRKIKIMHDFKNTTNNT